MKKLAILLMLLSGAASAQNCPYDPRSINNPNGAGNPYNPNSINNPYGAGNPYNPNPIYVVPSK